MENRLPILYSFRRCPYAMRARLALQSSGTACELREIVLRNKPAEMIESSEKATVPVLVLQDGTVLEESLDIMLWALDNHDPEHWLTPAGNSLDAMLELIKRCDDDFKQHLDRYKYSTRYENADPGYHRRQACLFLGELETRLAQEGHLFGVRPSLADMGIAPFIRQFANTDRPWFDQTSYTHVRRWLDRFTASAPFQSIMKKHPAWVSGEPGVAFPAPDAIPT